MPPSQGARALAALQQQQSQKVQQDVGSLTPPKPSRLSRSPGTGGSTLREPSLTSFDSNFDAPEEDYGFGSVSVPEMRVEPARSASPASIASPTHSTSRTSGRVRTPNSTGDAGAHSLLQPPFASHPKHLSSADVVRAGTALSKEADNGGNGVPLYSANHRRVHVPTNEGQPYRVSAAPAGLAAVRSNDWMPQSSRVGGDVSALVPPRAPAPMTSSSPKLKAIDHGFVGATSPRLAVKPIQPPSFGVDSRFTSAFQQPRPQGTYGHFDKQPQPPQRSYAPSYSSQFTSRVPAATPAPPPPPPAPPVYRDHSGFRNAGNTCYAASVLTALLRQPLFCSELALFVCDYGDVKVRREVEREEEYEETILDEAADDRTDGEDVSWMENYAEGNNEDDEVSLRAGLFDGANSDGMSPSDGASPTDENTATFNDFFSNSSKTFAATAKSEARDAREAAVAAAALARDEERERRRVYTREMVPPSIPVPRVVTRTRTVVVTERVLACPLHIALHAAVRKLQQPASIAHGISVDAIADAMSQYENFCYFFDDDQHDAHEFYVGLVSCIEEEALIAMRAVEAKLRRQKRKMMKRLRSDPDENAPATQEEEEASDVGAADVWVNKLLRGSMHGVIGCRRRECGMQQATREPFVNVSVPMTLPLPPSASTASTLPPTTPPDTEALIAASLSPDALDGYKCDKCHQSVLQYHGGCFDSAPPLLVVQWKRFTASVVDGVFDVRKNTSAVKVSQEFSVVSRPAHLLTKLGGMGSAACEGNHANANQDAGETVVDGDGGRVLRTTYGLKAIVMHQGMTLNAGHYITLFQATQRYVQAHNSAEDRNDIDELLGIAPPPPTAAVPAKGADEALWLTANDTEVQEVTDKMLNLATASTKSCYLAIYEAKGSVYEYDGAPAGEELRQPPDAGTKRSWVIQFPPLQDDPVPVAEPLVPANGERVDHNIACTTTFANATVDDDDEASYATLPSTIPAGDFDTFEDVRPMSPHVSCRMSLEEERFKIEAEARCDSEEFVFFTPPEEIEAPEI